MLVNSSSQYFAIIQEWYAVPHPIRIIFSISLDDLMGQLFAILVLTVAAAESAIGLAIILLYYRVRGSISVEKIHFLRG